jgi:three-Cys-motif partner protein
MQKKTVEQILLFKSESLPNSPARLFDKNFKSLNFPLWTQNKAKLIQEYLRLFEYITHHGTYIDGFAAPQNAAHEGMWAAKLVLEMEPKWFRDFWLCDISKIGVEKLKCLRASHGTDKRHVTVLTGDFNELVSTILNSGQITERTATFALLDQRTFECDWRTVVALSAHKRTNKIEQFYFFPTGWVDRSIGAVKTKETIERVKRWWGRDDWHDLLGMDGTRRAFHVARRFEEELKYGKATPFPIHSERRGGRVMYHMIHATDHAEALPLMVRAYRKVSGRSELLDTETQTDFHDLWARIENDEN